MGVRGFPARDISSLGAMGQGPGRFPWVVRVSRALLQFFFLDFRAFPKVFGVF